MTKDKIISGLKMTMELFLFDPSTGETCEPDDLNELSRTTYDACKGAVELLEKPEPHWIPVTERLSEEETDVLVTVHFLGLKRTHRNGWNEHIKESFYAEVASHINGEWSSASDEYKIAKDRHKVVAWMPLPEPYKGVTE